MSPYSYLAATRLDGLRSRTNATVTWVPVYLPGIMRAVGNRGPMEVAPKGTYAFKDINDWAKHYGLPEILLPDEFPFQAAQGLRLCLVADEQGKGAAFAMRMFHKIWAERRNANDESTLRESLGELGLDVEQSLARGQSDEIRAKLKANTDSAVSRGAFGVPTFFVGGEEMFVGNDRLMFVEKALTS